MRGIGLSGASVQNEWLLHFLQQPLVFVFALLSAAQKQLVANFELITLCSESIQFLCRYKQRKTYTPPKAAGIRLRVVLLKLIDRTGCTRKRMICYMIAFCYV